MSGRTVELADMLLSARREADLALAECERVSGPVGLFVPDTPEGRRLLDAQDRVDDLEDALRREARL